MGILFLRFYGVKFHKNSPHPANLFLPLKIGERSYESCAFLSILYPVKLFSKIYFYFELYVCRRAHFGGIFTDFASVFRDS